MESDHSNKEREEGELTPHQLLLNSMLESQQFFMNQMYQLHHNYLNLNAHLLKQGYKQHTNTNEEFYIDKTKQVQEADKAYNTKLIEDSLLPDYLTFEGKTKKAGPLQHVLLTGATGFVGAYLLKALLDMTQATIYCLIRAENDNRAWNRLKDNLKEYGVDCSPYYDRIIMLPGDLSKPTFDWSDEKYMYLHHQFDAIYHSAANVHFLKPYEELKATNVDGTKHLLSFASSKFLIPIHFVGTLRVCDTQVIDPDRVVLERDLEDSDALVEQGYAQSKWVADRMLSRAKHLGMPVTIYRANSIAPATDGSGKPLLHELLNTFFLTAISMGKIPDEGYNFDFSTVDYVANAMTSISLDPQNHGKVYHLNASPQKGALLIKIIHELGYPMEVMSYAEWFTHVKQYVEETNNFYLKALFPVFTHDFWEKEGKSWFEYICLNPYFDNSNARTALDRQGAPQAEYTKEAVLEFLLLFFIIEELLNEEEPEQAPENNDVLVLLSKVDPGAHQMLEKAVSENPGKKVNAAFIEDLDLASNRIASMLITKMQQSDEAVAELLGYLTKDREKNKIVITYREKVFKKISTTYNATKVVIGSPSLALYASYFRNESVKRTSNIEK